MVQRTLNGSLLEVLLSYPLTLFQAFFANSLCLVILNNDKHLFLRVQMFLNLALLSLAQQDNYDIHFSIWQFHGHDILDNLLVYMSIQDRKSTRLNSSHVSISY